MSKQPKKPHFQAIVQIGNFPHIKHYYASGVEFFTREQAIAAGEKWLRNHGYEVVQKYIHTRYVKRNPPTTPKMPNKRILNKMAEGMQRWVHDKRTRQQLGQADDKGRALQY
jgi:hypothetical protein